MHEQKTSLFIICSARTGSIAQPDLSMNLVCFKEVQACGGREHKAISRGMETERSGIWDFTGLCWSSSGTAGASQPWEARLTQKERGELLFQTLQALGNHTEGQEMKQAGARTRTDTEETRERERETQKHFSDSTEWLEELLTQHAHTHTLQKRQ